jgi:S-ribosylhomocysteine lyase LuxS involved in autoinducer biosynthesis
MICTPHHIQVTKSRRMRWVRYVGIMGNRTGVYRVMVGKPEKKDDKKRPWLRWEDNIKKDLKEIG